MDNHKQPPWNTSWLLVLCLITLVISACSFSDETHELKGVVVGKRDSDQILVVPNIDASVVRHKTPQELLAIAREKDGVYFSVDQQTFDAVTLGKTVVVYYDPDDGEEVSDPPRRRSLRVEILTD